MIHVKYVGCCPVPLMEITNAKLALSPLFLSFQLYYNACALHVFTRNERKNARGEKFDGELDSFQEPQLSSLMRLVCLHPDWFPSEC
jgi:hypothetical protein